MIPFLALYFSSLNIEFKNELLRNMLILILNEVFFINKKNIEYVEELVDYDDISCDWEII